MKRIRRGRPSERNALRAIDRYRWEAAVGAGGETPGEPGWKEICHGVRGQAI